MFLLLNAWLGTGPDSPERYNQDGILKLEAFDFKGAVSDFQAALALNSDSKVLRVNLGLAFYYLGAFEKAGQQLSHVLKEDPREPYAYFLCGVIADRGGRTAEAVDYFKTVLDLAPGDPGTYYHLGLIALRDEKPDQAVELFEKSLAGNPDCTASLYNLGRALALSGKKTEGKAALEKFQLLQSRKKTEPGGGMGNPVLLVGEYGQPRGLPKE